MSAIAADHDGQNPFQNRQPAPPPPDDAAADDAPPDDSDAQPAPGKTDEAKIAFAAKMAAGRAAKRLERQRKAAAPITPDKPIIEAERLRAKATNWLPDNTTFEARKRVDGHLVWVGNYSVRDIQSSKSAEQFIHQFLYKKHRATEWEITFVSADGRERAPNMIFLDPEALGKEDPVMQRMVEKLDEVNGRPSQMKEAVGALRELKELQSDDGPAPPAPTTMVEYLMFRDAMQPREDPRVAKLEAKLDRVLDQLSQPPPAPIQLPPPGPDPVQAAVALAQVLIAPMQAQNAAMQAQMAADRADARAREDRLLTEMRKASSPGGQGGLEGLRDQLKLLKEIDTERGGGGGTDITKLVTAVGGFLKDMKANDPNQQPAASPKIESAPAPGPLTFPPGTAELAAKITEAKDDNERVSALMILYQHIMQSGDPLFLRFHSVIVEHAKKGEAAEVREYVEGFLDALKATLPEATRKAAMAAYDAKADGIVKALSES